MNKIPPSWETISVLGKSKVVKRSYIFFILVPIFARFFSLLENPVIIGEYEFMFGLPFSWKLFFLSALLFTIANLFYQIRTPRIIIENRYFGDFVQQRKNFIHLFQYLEDLRINDKFVQSIEKKKAPTEEEEEKRKLYQIIRQNCEKFNWSSTARQRAGIDHPDYVKLKVDEYWKVNEAEYLEYSFWNLYSHANFSRKGLRWLISILYVIGIILIGIVTVQNILTVFLIK